MWGWVVVSSLFQDSRMGAQWWVVDHGRLNVLHATLSGRDEIRLRKDTDLVIEGYPRSANTLLSQGLMVMNPGLRCATRSHGTGVIRLAMDRGVPVILTLRRPEEAIPSCAAYLRIDVMTAARRYAEFHENVAPLGLPVVPFEALTRDRSDVSSLLEPVVGRCLRWPGDHAEWKQMEDRIVGRFGEHPSTPRDQVAAAARDFERLPASMRRRVGEAHEGVLQGSLAAAR